MSSPLSARSMLMSWAMISTADAPLLNTLHHLAIVFRLAFIRLSMMSLWRSSSRFRMVTRWMWSRTSEDRERPAWAAFAVSSWYSSSLTRTCIVRPRGACFSFLIANLFSGGPGGTQYHPGKAPLERSYIG